MDELWEPWGDSPLGFVAYPTLRSPDGRSFPQPPSGVKVMSDDDGHYFMIGDGS